MSVRLNAMTRYRGLCFFPHLRVGIATLGVGFLMSLPKAPGWLATVNVEDFGVVTLISVISSKQTNLVQAPLFCRT